MTIPTADGFAAMVVALNECLIAIGAGVEDERTGAEVRTAQGIATALSHMAAELLGPEEDDVELGPATDDPETCGHPNAFDGLPNGQVMCETCGASRVGDSDWAVI